MTALPGRPQRPATPRRLRRPRRMRWVAGCLALVVQVAGAVAAPAAACQARSGDRQTLLVELYTSEGCNSCPPADRWLSSLVGRSDVLAAAFHVEYWDRLGWVDRFASPRHTERQTQQQRSSGAGFSYTPQVLANGRDWRGAPALPLLDRPALVQVQARRQDERRVAVRIEPRHGAPARLGLWWAWLEDGHVSTVRAGENQGVTLRHDHVVRQYGQLPTWAAQAGQSAPQLIDMAPHKSESGHRARLLVVVTDGSTGAPLQALQLDC